MKQIKSKHNRVPVLAATLLAVLSSGAQSDYKADIGFTTLSKQLGIRAPTGAGVRVAQVEADASGAWMPDPGLAEFSGKTINNLSGNLEGIYSEHAAGVGQLFYGKATSIAPGIRIVDSYEANDWLNSLSTDTGGVATGASRIANHSWVGDGYDSIDLVDHSSDILRRVDRVVEHGEWIQVVAMNNGSGNRPLLGSAYNVIAVGRTDGDHAKGSHKLSKDTTYTGGRTRPDIVAPQGSTSAATPVVAAAAALLVQTGHRGSTRLSKGSTSLAQIGTVYNAERSETIKAALMAGADRHTRNTSTPANIADYRGTGYKTSNGLDTRYGAGQVNIWNSYRILAAGEQDSQQDGGRGNIKMNGFDYDGSFGGPNGSNRTASYFFTVNSKKVLSAALVWNLKVANNRSLKATLPNLNLILSDRTAGSIRTVAQSNSTRDNTENLWVQLLGGHRYELRVSVPGSLSSPLDYALAWHISH